MKPVQEFKKVTTGEEFLNIFQGLCNIAHEAYDLFEERFEILSGNNKIEIVSCHKELSYLMSITLVIMGMRGQYMDFRNGVASLNVEKDGSVYNQDYLYTMNNYFIDRFNTIIARLEKIDPELVEPHKKIWEQCY